MALVVFLRGINVGGYRRLRPAALAAKLEHLDAVNIGAAGTFVVRAPVGRRQVRDDISRQLPFPSEIVICDGKEVSRLLSQNHFSGHRVRPDIVRFASVMSRAPRRTPTLPTTLPIHGRWLVKVLARDGRFLVGLHRREMKVIGTLAELDRMFGTRTTTRGWNTMKQIAKVLSTDENR